jgi:hypothetical protein
MRFVLVELDDGDQEFFDTAYEAFRYAKKKENERKHSVEYVAIGEFLEDDDYTVYKGQALRHLIRSLDNVTSWVRTVRHENEDGE